MSSPINLLYYLLLTHNVIKKKNNTYKNEELYFVFFLFFFGAILYFWSVQLDSEYKKEWQVSVTLFCLLLRYIISKYNIEILNEELNEEEEEEEEEGAYIGNDDDKYNKPVTTKPVTKKNKFNIVLVILYLLISIFGVFGHNSADKNPVLAWLLTSSYLLLLYTLQDHVLF